MRRKKVVRVIIQEKNKTNKAYSSFKAQTRQVVLVRGDYFGSCEDFIKNIL